MPDAHSPGTPPTLTALFGATFRTRAEALALEHDAPDGTRRLLTFADVEARALRMAATLRARGLRAGDRCVVHLANGVAFLDLFLACLRLRVVMVPANVLYRGRELAHIAADSDPALIVTAAEHRDLFAADARVVTVEALLADAVARAPDDAPPPPDDDEAPALIIYTSGTTGRAKGAVLSRRNLAANARNLCAAWRITAADRYLAVLPLFHVHGLGNGVCTWLASGCQMRLLERFEAAKAAQWFDEFRPTLFFGVPTVYVRLLELPADAARAMGASMRLFVCGSAPLPAPVMDAFRQRFGHVILERYGMSETLMNIGNPYDGERRPGSVGVPFPGVEARIVDESAAPVPEGTVGQLEVRGANVFAGYWRNPEATAKAFRDGWFRTGDMAERAPDGYYTLRGRASDLIISGGFNIYPREIEELLLDQPGVREAAVVGVPDARRGEVPVAYVVADAAVTDDALRAACAAALASFKTPRAFVRVDGLPRTALGKVQKHLLPAPPA